MFLFEFGNKNNNCLQIFPIKYYISQTFQETLLPGSTGVPTKINYPIS